MWCGVGWGQNKLPNDCFQELSDFEVSTLLKQHLFARLVLGHLVLAMAKTPTPNPTEKKKKIDSVTFF